MECEERLERLQRAVDQGQSWIYEDNGGLDLILCKQEYVWLTFVIPLAVIQVIWPFSSYVTSSERLCLKTQLPQGGGSKLWLE